MQKCHLVVEVDVSHILSLANKSFSNQHHNFGFNVRLIVFVSILFHFFSAFPSCLRIFFAVIFILSINKISQKWKSNSYWLPEVDMFWVEYWKIFTEIFPKNILVWMPEKLESSGYCFADCRGINCMRDRLLFILHTSWNILLMLLNVKETDIQFGVKCYDIMEWNSNLFVKWG